MAGRGRPRSFDRTDALERAMEVFWRLGYEGASMADLTAAMGINSPSLYAAFGCKDALFREAVEHYAATAGSSTLRALQEASSARAAIRGALRASVESSTRPERPQGCLLVLGATNCSTQNLDLQQYLRDRRHCHAAELRLRIERALAEGELPPGTDTAALTAFYVTLLQGLALQARDGTPRESLLAVAEQAMAVWDRAATPARPG